MKYSSYTHQDLMNMPTEVRRTFFPKISGIRSAVIVGSQDSSRHTNAALFNSLMHIGSWPPLLGVIFRPLTVERHTYENIKEVNHYSINLIRSEDLDAAHQCSAKYPRSQSEFTAVGKAPVPSNLIPAPYWPNALIQIGLKYKEEHFIQANETILLIGEVQELHVHDSCLNGQGIPDFSGVSSLLVNGLESYYSHRALGQKEYARPD